MAIKLTGNTIKLRALEPEDLNLVFKVENDESLWHLSTTLAPFSKQTITEYLENAYRDIFEVRQLRLIIASKENDEALGMIDLFDYDPKHRRAGVGILIFEQADRGKGIATEALSLLIDYSFKHLDMHQLYANIIDDNLPSIRLFENKGFKQIGLKKDWLRIEGQYRNEFLYQLIHTDVH